jgi:hypothetical protein
MRPLFALSTKTKRILSSGAYGECDADLLGSILGEILQSTKLLAKNLDSRGKP